MQITITDGTYRGNPVNGTFEMVTGYKEQPSGKRVVKVRGAGEFDMAEGVVVQVQVKSQDSIVYLDAEGKTREDDTVREDGSEASVIEQYLANESDEEAMARIKKTFDIVEEMAEAAAGGVIRGMIVSGPAGIGKSFGVERVMERHAFGSELRGAEVPYSIVKGTATGIGLYQLLYKHSEIGQTLVFDDCDSILFDEVCLNLLKGALDTSDKRVLSWNAESKALENNGVPEKFEFKGTVVFLTNLNFENVRGRTGDHLSAIMSRCHYLDMAMDGERDCILRIKQVVRDGMLTKFGFTPLQEEEIVNYVVDNAPYLRELSLRMVKKVADLYAAMPTKWREMAEMTCMEREAKFKRLLENKKEFVTN